MTKYQFGPTSPEPYPSEMRTQLWPLCCGAAILSGFKDVGALTQEKLIEKINSVVDKWVPDHQVFKDETIQPKFVMLTLNRDQMASAKIMNAIAAAGFVKFGEATLRNHPQGFFVRDQTKSFKVVT